MEDEQFDYDYLWKNFYNAVDTLATGTGSIKTRLVDAAMTNIMLYKPEDIPDEIREKFVSIYSQLDNISAVGTEGRLQASVDIMTDYEASQVAGVIVELFNYIAVRTEPD